jgi:murein DD-endopeptidase MepM/ murein hydrolase activator NlpD
MNPFNTTMSSSRMMWAVAAALMGFVVGGCDSSGDGSGSGDPVATPFMSSPFEGEYEVTNLFDHSTTELWATEGEHLIAFWGEQVRGLPGHRGYDWLMPEGVPLLAVADGIVHRVGVTSDEYCPPLGTMVRNQRVVLSHDTAEGDRFLSIYSHVSETEVGLGERVDAGQVVARSGNTGCSTDPHLHFQVQYRGRTNARTTVGSLGVPGRRYVDVDPFGWSGTGDDPWAGASRGGESWWLWIPGKEPPLTGRGPE